MIPNDVSKIIKIAIVKWPMCLNEKMDKNSKEMKMINGMYFVNTNNAVIKSTM